MRPSTSASATPSSFTQAMKGRQRSSLLQSPAKRRSHRLAPDRSSRATASGSGVPTLTYNQTDIAGEYVAKMPTARR